VTTTSDSGARGGHDLNAIAAYAERRLDDNERALVERHLVGCEECRATLATYARGASAVSETRGTRPASGFRFDRTSWLALAATAVLAVGVSFYMRTELPEPTQPLGRAPESPAGGTVGPPVQSPAARVPSPVSAPPRAGDRAGLSTTRGGQRQVGGKTFRLEAGAWVDSTYDARKALPTTDVSGIEARAALLRDKPALKPYAALGAQVTVVLDGVVYRFDMK
jgi:Putative zinc-finger